MYTMKQYRVTIQMNGEEFNKRGEDVKEAILSVKPEQLHTDMYITVSTGSGENKTTAERSLSLLQGKRLFVSEDALEVFINNLMLE
jgi:hypothetical protein